MSSKFVVTGGGGFVGRAIALELKRLGHEVVSLSRGNYPDLEKAGVRAERADLGSNPNAWQDHFSGAEAVFHVAAKVDMWGRYREFYKANVIATQNVIAACKARGVKKLIFTSSPSVIAVDRDLDNVDESIPYPAHYRAYYPQTKAIAEKIVLAENSEDLFTISLRPHLIWGPGDRNFIPAVLKRAQAGRFDIIGNGKNLVDLTFIEDCVRAHLLAFQALTTNPNCRGKPYFISQGEPISLWQWLYRVLELNGLKPRKRYISRSKAMITASVLEVIYKYAPGGQHPALTKFLVSQMTTNHYFNIAAAKRDLGFVPEFTIEQALARTFKALPLPRSIEKITAVG